jgi:hypothetical protein
MDEDKIVIPMDNDREVSHWITFIRMKAREARYAYPLTSKMKRMTASLSLILMSMELNIKVGSRCYVDMKVDQPQQQDTIQIQIPVEEEKQREDFVNEADKKSEDGNMASQDGPTLNKNVSNILSSFDEREINPLDNRIPMRYPSVVNIPHHFQIKQGGDLMEENKDPETPKMFAKSSAKEDKKKDTPNIKQENEESDSEGSDGFKFKFLLGDDDKDGPIILDNSEKANSDISLKIRKQINSEPKSNEKGDAPERSIKEDQMFIPQPSESHPLNNPLEEEKLPSHLQEETRVDPSSNLEKESNKSEESDNMMIQINLDSLQDETPPETIQIKSEPPIDNPIIEQASPENEFKFKLILEEEKEGEEGNKSKEESKSKNTLQPTQRLTEDQELANPLVKIVNSDRKKKKKAKEKKKKKKRDKEDEPITIR